MKAISATLVRHKSCDEMFIYTDIPDCEVLGILTFKTVSYAKQGEKWIRDNFGDIAIKVIDRRGERG